MAKKQKQPTKTCTDCIHESACRIWTDGRFISDASASVCPNHETVKESAAYLCGVLDERKRKQTNADRIRAMISTDEGLAKMLMKLGDKGVYIPLCKDKAECLELLEIDAIPESKCMECLLDWLRQSVERED